MTEKDTLKYCYDRGLDWEGLYEKMGRVSCWCCPLSSIPEKEALYKEHPELWEELIKMDQLSFRKFRPDYSIENLTDRFEHSCMWKKEK